MGAGLLVSGTMNDEQDLAERYRALGDLHLMKLANADADLTPQARAALRAEFARRGLLWPEMKVEPAPMRFGRMSNRELLMVARQYERLAEEEQAGLRYEFASRGLEPPLVEEDDSEQTDEESEPIRVGDDLGDFVTVRSYRDLSDAIVARSALEQAEIPCFLRDEHSLGIYWGWSNLIGGARLQVPATYAEAAEEVLSQPIPVAFATDDGEYVQPVCPRCGSLQVMADDLERKIKLTSTLAAGLPMVVGLPALAWVKKGVWKCGSCGCKWTDDELAGEA